MPEESPNVDCFGMLFDLENPGCAFCVKRDLCSIRCGQINIDTKILFSNRLTAEREFMDWCDKNHAAASPQNVLVWLMNDGRAYLRKLVDYAEGVPYRRPGERADVQNLQSQ